MIIGIIILCVACIALFFIKNKAYFYRVYQKKVYNSFVARLTKVVNELNIHKTFLFTLSDKSFIDYFDSYIELLNSTIKVVANALAASVKKGELEKAGCYVDECCRRAKVIKLNFLNLQKGGVVNHRQLVMPRAGWYRKSCYFCSQPIFNQVSARTSIIVEGSPKKVLGCMQCKRKLKTTKKINILFFVQDGKRVHWSKNEDYLPSVDHWDMNLKKDAKG